MKLTPGALVVLEGLDATGKSTQLDVLAELYPEALCIHSPSSSTDLGAAIYEVTERATLELLPLTRQFLHLASHAEMYEREILPALRHRAVIMDRNWWSTVAYGYFGTQLMYRADLDVETFMRLARMPARGVWPDLTFLFLDPHVFDRHNTSQLLAGYQWLRDHTRQRVVLVPRSGQEETTELLLAWLKDAGLAVG